MQSAEISDYIKNKPGWLEQLAIKKYYELQTDLGSLKHTALHILKLNPARKESGHKNMEQAEIMIV